MRSPSEQEMQLLRLIQDRGPMWHSDERLEPFCSDEGTLTNPDVFNSCHDLGWLRSGHDDRVDDSVVRITEAGKNALAVNA